MIFFPKMFKIHFKIQINTRGPNIYIYIYIYLYFYQINTQGSTVSPLKIGKSMEFIKNLMNF